MGRFGEGGKKEKNLRASISYRANIQSTCRPIRIFGMERGRGRGELEKMWRDRYTNDIWRCQIVPLKLENRTFQKTECSMFREHEPGEQQSNQETKRGEQERMGEERNCERRKRDNETRAATRRGGCMNYGGYVFESTRNDRMVEIQKFRSGSNSGGIGPCIPSSLFHARYDSVCSWFPLPLPRTHLIYGSVYA